jgi:hypothetical protein
MGLLVAGPKIPADLTFSDILKQQIELTRHFINSQQRMYQVYHAAVEKISADYKPITLEDTRQVICYLYPYIIINRTSNGSK